MDHRQFDPRPAIDGNVLDFVDVHAYPHVYFSNVAAHAHAFGYDAATRKPVVICELGAHRAVYADNFVAAESRR